MVGLDIIPYQFVENINRWKNRALVDVSYNFTAVTQEHENTKCCK